MISTPAISLACASGLHGAAHEISLACASGLHGAGPLPFIQARRLLIQARSASKGILTTGHEAIAARPYHLASRPVFTPCRNTLPLVLIDVVFASMFVSPSCRAGVATPPSQKQV